MRFERSGCLVMGSIPHALCLVRLDPVHLPAKDYGGAKDAGVGSGAGCRGSYYHYLACVLSRHR